MCGWCGCEQDPAVTWRLNTTQTLGGEMCVGGVGVSKTQQDPAVTWRLNTTQTLGGEVYVGGVGVSKTQQSHGN